MKEKMMVSVNKHWCDGDTQERDVVCVVDSYENAKMIINDLTMRYIHIYMKHAKADINIQEDKEGGYYSVRIYMVSERDDCSWSMAYYIDDIPMYAE